MKPTDITALWLDASQACYTDTEHTNGKVITRINPGRETAELFIKAREASRSLPTHGDMDENRHDVEKIFERFSDCFNAGFPAGLEHKMADVRRFLKTWLCHTWEAHVS